LLLLAVGAGRGFLAVVRSLLLFLCLGADALEDCEAAFLWHSDVEGADIGVGNLVNSRLHNFGVLAQ